MINDQNDQPPSSPDVYPEPGYEIYLNPRLPGMEPIDRQGRQWKWVDRPLPDSTQGHEISVTAIGYSPNGDQVVSLDVDETMILWDADQGVPIKRINDAPHGVCSLQVSPDGNLVVIGIDHVREIKAVVWDLRSEQQRYTLPKRGDDYAGIVISPSARPALLTAEGNDLTVWDLESGQLRQTLRGHTGPIRSIAVVPDGSLALTASADATVKVWDLSKGKERFTFRKHTGMVYGVAVSADGQTVVSISTDQTLRVWDLMTGRQRHVFDNVSAEYLVQIRSDSRIAISRGERGMRVWDLAHKAWRIKVDIFLEDCLDTIALVPNSSLAVFTMEDWLTGYYYMLHVIDTDSGEVVYSYRNNSSINCFAIAPSGKTIVIGDMDGKVHFLDLIQS